MCTYLLHSCLVDATGQGHCCIIMRISLLIVVSLLSSSLPHASIYLLTIHTRTRVHVHMCMHNHSCLGCRSRRKASVTLTDYQWNRALKEAQKKMESKGAFNLCRSGTGNAGTPKTCIRFYPIVLSSGTVMIRTNSNRSIMR